MDNQNNQTSPITPNPSPAPVSLPPPAPSSLSDLPIAPTNASVNVVGNRAQIAAKLKQSYNILVTVNSNPNIDELTALLGLSLVFSKLKKHVSAVFSGEVPSILEFLEPEKTFEKNTDSFQDFIIAIDKSKADKLKYKVEDNRVRIFITPYRTSISEDDLEFSLGDLNVDAIVALGVNKQEDIDQAIAAHGKILHDATIIAISNSPEPSTVGTLNWVDTTTSSLSEMVTLLANDLGAKDLIDAQIATSLLTGIVSNTKRFANDKTSPQSLSVSSQLLSAGANQQLVADKLEPAPVASEPAPAPIIATLPEVVPESVEDDSANALPSLIKSDKNPKKKEEEKTNLGELDIDHTEEDLNVLAEAERVEKIRIDQSGNLQKEGEDYDESEPVSENASSSTGDSNNPTPVTASPQEVTPLPPVLPPQNAPIEPAPTMVSVEASSQTTSSPNPLVSTPTPIVPNPLVSGHNTSGDPYMNHNPMGNSDSNNSTGGSEANYSEAPSNGSNINNSYMLNHDSSIKSSGLVSSLPNAPTSPSISFPAQTVAPDSASEIEQARRAVSNLAQPTTVPPVAFNALPLGNELHDASNNAPGPSMDMPLPTNLVPPVEEPTTSSTSLNVDPTSPPPVPPPLIGPLPQ